MRLPLFALAALCVSNLAAHADTVTNYQLTAFTDDGGELTGTFNIDQNDPSMSSSNLVYTMGATSTNILYASAREPLMETRRSPSPLHLRILQAGPKLI